MSDASTATPFAAAKIGRPPSWTEEEMKFLLDNHHEMSSGQIAKALGKTRSAVCGVRYRLKLPKVSRQEAIARMMRTKVINGTARPVASCKPRVRPSKTRAPTEVEIRRRLTTTAIHVDPASPEARAAAALLATAQSAERRRDGFRERGVL